MANWNSLLNDAIKIAVEAHHIQVDKSGEPYILHPLRVMFAVEKIEHKIVAILHDVIEDTSITIENLRTYGFPEGVLDSIIAITRNKNGKGHLEDNNQYIARVYIDEWARVVKIADIKDNLMPKRFAKLDEKTQERLMKKYLKALKILQI